MTERILAFAFGFAAVVGIISMLEAPQTDHKLREAAKDARRAIAEAKVERWAYVAQESALSGSETLRAIRIPSRIAPGSDLADRLCLLYTHTEYQVAELVCGR